MARPQPCTHACTYVCVRASVAPGHALRQQPFLTDLEADLLSTVEGGAAAVAALTALRAVLLQPHRMNVFVAGDLTKMTAPHAALAAALRPPSGAPAAAPAPAAGPISGVEQHRLLSGREAQVVAATRAVTGTRCAMHHAPPCTTMQCTT